MFIHINNNVVAGDARGNRLFAALTIKIEIIELFSKNKDTNSKVSKKQISLNDDSELTIKCMLD